MNTAPAFPMSIGFVGMTVARHVAEALTKREKEGAHARALTRREEHYQGKNVYCRGGALDWLKYAWSQIDSAPPGPAHAFYPWRPPAAWDGQNMNVRAAAFGASTGTTGLLQYPVAYTSFGLLDYSRNRYFAAPVSLLAAAVPRVIGGVFVNGPQHAHTPGNAYPSMLAFSEVQTTQIGVGYGHPSHTFTANWTLGDGYITAPNWSYVFAWLMNHMGNYLRINVVGADKGVYRIRHWDPVNSRVYLTNLDGSRWVAQTSATAGSISVGPGTAYFNQTSIIPNSVGTTSFDGVFVPGENRTSYLFRLFFEKSGSPSPADAAQRGTYWFMTRPLLYGHGDESSTEFGYRDFGGLAASRMQFASRGLFPDAATYPELQAGWISAGWVGGCPGLFLDRTNQRLWGASNNGADGNIWWWRYKSPETVHEIATTTGVPNDAISGITLTGSTLRALVGDDEGAVYVALNGGANAGVVKITSGLVATQWLASSGGLGADVAGLKADVSRARTSATNTVTTSAGTGNMGVTGMAFTQADVGRAIKISTGADAGTYLISVVTDATNITVTTLAGAAVTFAGQAATGTAQIGTRIWILWADATSWAGSGGATTIAPRYMESIAFGSILKTADLTVTSGTGRNVYVGERVGAAPPVDVDAQTGNLYWVSTDTATTLNRYDVSAGTISQKALSTFTTPTGGGGTISTPTIVHAVGANPHASFREVWLATDQGWVKFSATAALSALTAADYQRYSGRGDSTGYTNPANSLRPDGDSWSATRVARYVLFGADGKVWGVMQAVGATGEFVTYNRDHDLFTTAWDQNGSSAFDGTYGTGCLVTPYGELATMTPALGSTGALGILSVPTCYQWVGGAWVAKDVQRGALPDSTSSPGLSCKDLHTTLDDLLYGVKVKFTPQGGATPANNEFVGRVGLTGAQRADGSVALGSGTFTGSGFTSADVGRYLRVEKSGGDTVNDTDVDVYLVTAYLTANTVTLKRVSGNGAAWTATADGTCHYTVWDPGTYGPDCVTVTAWNGFGKDNTQDVTNILYEVFLGAKTVVSENVEGVKVACGLIGPAGSVGVSVYADTFAMALNPNYSPGIPQALGMPTGLTLGEQLLYGLANTGNPDGTLGRVNKGVAGTSWGGIAANGGTQGLHYAVDFGVDVEVGAVIVRIFGQWGLLYTEGANQGGMIVNLHRALEAGGAPVAASTVRLTGTGLSLALSATTASLSAGDFLGAVTTGGLTDGETTLGGNTITSAAGRFTGREGQVVRLTSGADQGYYRVFSVDGTGAIATVRTLNQSAVTFTASAVGLNFDLYANAVREEDVLSVPAGVGTHKVTVERLLTATSAQVRQSPASALSGQTWDALVPTWTLAKRVPYSVVGTAPNQPNNGCYAADDARERGDGVTAYTLDVGQKVVFDFSDLTTAKRTGRYWKFSVMPRWSGFTNVGAAVGVTSMEFYDPSGKRIDLLPDNRLDTVESLANFFAAHVQRIDWIQAANGAASHLAGVNGNADVGGALGNTVTLNTGGNKFLGYQVRAGTTMSAVGGDNTLNTTGADPAFTASDVGRLLRVAAGANAGYYRVSTVPSATQVTVTTPAGNAVTLLADAGPTAWSIHEGINVGAVNYDYITLSGVDYPLLTLSDDLTTLTIGVTTGLSLTNVAWEIRRRAIPAGTDYSTAAPAPAGTDATKSARIVYSAAEFARQPGDFVQDSKGTVACLNTDIGTPVARADGAMAGGNGVFTGSGFTADDVNRILVITAGANKGPYRISVYTNPTTVTVVNARTGAAVTFAADAGPQTYKVVGERRFKISRYVSVLRQ